MIDLFQRARWSEFYIFFAKGDPPLVALLLCLNTIFFVLWILRRMRGASTLRRETAIIVQSLLIFANFALVFHEDFIRFTNLGRVFNKVLAGIPF